MSIDDKDVTPIIPHGMYEEIKTPSVPQTFRVEPVNSNGLSHKRLFIGMEGGNIEKRPANTQEVLMVASQIGRAYSQENGFLPQQAADILTACRDEIRMAAAQDSRRPDRTEEETRAYHVTEDWIWDAMVVPSTMRVLQANIAERKNRKEDTTSLEASLAQQAQRLSGLLANKPHLSHPITW